DGPAGPDPVKEGKVPKASGSHSACGGLRRESCLRRPKAAQQLEAAKLLGWPAAMLMCDWMQD
ncbi:hypothetical protein, partial [Alicyclobacillus cycloheptanicus]|uniref:hypothetical protein n=1 Tax=Alicyclobacillus cycloheptanicus TaxID=1457 RepID=UPI003966C407